MHCINKEKPRDKENPEDKVYYKRNKDSKIKETGIKVNPKYDVMEKCYCNDDDVKFESTDLDMHINQTEVSSSMH